MPPTMSRPTPTSSAAANGSSSTNGAGNGNVAASADPFYVFKECVRLSLDMAQMHCYAVLVMRGTD